MKAILISIQSPHTCNILNLIKLLEIRKKFPKDYVGWVYIYVTKNGEYLMKKARENGYITCMRSIQPKQMAYSKSVLNGKVVARFWCDKVEEILFDLAEKEWFTDTLEEKELLKESCLSQEKLDDYLQGKNGYAIHITKLEIFDKPKEIREFTYWKDYGDCKQTMKLTRAPQSWCYVEV